MKRREEESERRKGEKRENRRGRNNEEEEEHDDDKLKQSQRMRKTGLKQHEEKWWRRNLKNIKKDRQIAIVGERERRGMKSSNKKKRGKWQAKMRKASCWCNWEMKGKKR